ncbi:hypothetical protein [Prevotella melaninogenica]|uniref:hypothetical protein n=1 Tax=Prevotella melaninogenica TaxID=28132 RepID=UPI001C5FCAA1|nr:hypothetical protein [Prevotella melaninogenica]MBW4880422.1 hypothetical protein [Prevotella melaninogenica]
MRIFKESKQKHLYFSAAFALSLALAPTGVYAVIHLKETPHESVCYLTFTEQYYYL